MATMRSLADCEHEYDRARDVYRKAGLAHAIFGVLASILAVAALSLVIHHSTGKVRWLGWTAVLFSVAALIHPLFSYERKSKAESGLAQAFYFTFHSYAEAQVAIKTAIENGKAFIRLFPVSQEKADTLMTSMAQVVAGAYADQERLLRKGVTWTTPDPSISSDQAMLEAKREFDKAWATRQWATAKAVERFFFCRDRVREQDLVAHEFYTDYPLPKEDTPGEAAA